MVLPKVDLDITFEMYEAVYDVGIRCKVSGCTVVATNGMSTSTPVVVRAVKENELPAVYHMIQTNVDDWLDVTMETLEIYYRLDRLGFKVAVLCAGGNERIIGSFYACNIDSKHGFGDLFVISRTYRGLGIGTQLLREAVRHFGDRNWAVDAEVGSMKYFTTLGCKRGKQTQSYCGYPIVEKNGAKILPNDKAIGMCLDIDSNEIRRNNASRSMQHSPVVDEMGMRQIKRRRNSTKTYYELTSEVLKIVDLTVNSRSKVPTIDTVKCCCNSKKCKNYSIISEKDLRFADIVKYDTEKHCTPRWKHLKLWFQYSGSVTYVCIDANRYVVGYVCARPISENDYEIGPLYAEQMCIAQCLLLKAITYFPGRHLYIQVPLANTQAVKMVESLGLEQDGGPYTRMYSTTEMPIPYESVYVTHKFGFA